MSSTTTTTVTVAEPVSSRTVNGTGRQQEQEQRAATTTRITSTRTNHSGTTKGTNGSDTTSTELAPKAPSSTTTTTTIRTINGEPHSNQSRTEHHTTLHHAEQASARHGNLQVTAKGTADASASQMASQSRRTMVQSDGAIISSGQSTRSSTLKYAVEASSVQEKIIRYGNVICDPRLAEK